MREKPVFEEIAAVFVTNRLFRFFFLRIATDDGWREMV